MKSTEKEKDDGKGASAEPAAPAVDEKLVKLKKDDEQIAVHPTCVNAHTRKGWKLA